MFLGNSRYATLDRVDVTTRSGRRASALKLRILPPTPGEPHQVEDRDRLDLLAHARYGDATRWWRVADANTALDATTLTAATGDIVTVPRSR